jgi:hypothetical protein
MTIIIATTNARNPTNGSDLSPSYKKIFIKTNLGAPFKFLNPLMTTTAVADGVYHRRTKMKQPRWAGK